MCLTVCFIVGLLVFRRQSSFLRISWWWRRSRYRDWRHRYTQWSHWRVCVTLHQSLIL